MPFLSLGPSWDQNGPQVSPESSGTAPDPILNRFGMALGFVFVGFDITKSKKSTAKIIVLKLLFATLLDKLA